MSDSPRERKWVQIEHPESRNDSPVTGYGLGFYIRGTGSAIEQRVHVVTTVSATCSSPKLHPVGKWLIYQL